MDSNTHSTDGPIEPADQRPSGPPVPPANELTALVADLTVLAAQDPDQLSSPARTERVLQLRRRASRLDGQWLKELAGVDACGAAGAEQDRQFGSTASWLRVRLRMAAGQATTAVRTARTLFRGPLPATGAALLNGEFSVAHAEVLAASTLHVPDHVIHAAEATLLDAARRLDPTGLRKVVSHLQYTVDPDGADAAAQRRYARRGLWCTTTMDRLVAVRGILDPEAGQLVQAALEPLARPADAADTRSGGQRTADALTELARRQLEGGRLPKTGGVRPQLSVIVDLPSLQGPEGLAGRLGRLGGDIGWAGPLDPEACRRLACDATLIRVLVSRQPLDAGGHGHGHGPHDRSAAGLEGLLRAVLATLPRSWVAPPAAPWTWAGPPGSSPRPNAAPWPCGMAAVSSQVVRGRWPGVRAIMCGTGWMAARPIWTTWPWCVGPIIGPSMRTAGGSSADPTASTPPPHHTEHTGPPSSRCGAGGRRPSTRDRPPDPPGQLPVTPRQRWERPPKV